MAGRSREDRKGDRKGMTKENGQEFNWLDFLTELCFYRLNSFVRFYSVLSYFILFYSKVFGFFR